MVTIEQLIEFLRKQAAEKTYEDVQSEDESPADCGNYDDAYEMGRTSGQIRLAQKLVAWLDGAPEPRVVTGFTPDEDEDEDEDED